MLPSPVPRITDVPRLNGMGGMSTREGGVDEIGEKHCSTPTGGTFAGFQRQESVEAYQIAVAANGVAKQRRTTLEIEEEGEEDQWEAVSNRKMRRKSTQKQQQRQFHISADSSKDVPNDGQNVQAEQHSDRQFWRLFGDRSVDSLQPRPLSASVNFQKHRENSRPFLAKNSAFSTTNRTSMHDFAKGVWNNDSMSKLAMPMHQFAPRVQNRVVQPLLSLTSATFSPLNFQQQPKGPFCKGTRGGRRIIAETGRRNSGRRGGRTWTSEWGRTAMTTESNLNNHHQSFVGGTYGLNGHSEDETVREKELGTMRRIKRASEREGGGRETEAQTTRQNRTKTSEQKRPVQEQQNSTALPQRHHFRRHSGETTDKDTNSRKYSLAKDTSDGVRQEQPKELQQKTKFNFEEREFPALLSFACAPGDFAQIGHADQKQKNSCDPSASAVTLHSTDSQTVPSTVSSSSNVVQLQFSAVVAGNGRRRATIGTTMAESARKATGTGVSRTADDRGMEGPDTSQQQRSGTIGAAEKSYAQMLKGWPK